MLFNDKLKIRRDAIQQWLIDNYCYIKHEQAHLDEGTPERGYWHAGYSSALSDILALMNKELTRPTNTNSHQPDNCN